MCYPVCVMMHIKEPLLLIGNSSPCGGSGFLLSLSEWSFTICLAHVAAAGFLSRYLSGPLPYVCKMLSASSNKTFPFLPYIQRQSNYIISAFSIL